MKVKCSELSWHSGGMYSSSYYTSDDVNIDVYIRGAEHGVRGDIGPFLKVGDMYFTKKQVEKLAQAIADEVAKMP